MKDTNTYKWFYKNRSGEIESDTSFHAQQAMQQTLKLKDKERPKITVVLVAKGGQPVVHDPASL